MGTSQEVAEDSIESLPVYDAEIHTPEDRLDLVEFLSSEEFKEQELNGYNGPEEFGPIPWDGWDRSSGGRIQYSTFSKDKEDFKQFTDDFGVDKGILSPGLGFKICQIPDANTRVRYMRAMNDYTVDFAADVDSTYGKILILPEHPKESAEEIERFGGNDEMISIFISSIGTEYPIGHERHEPIFEAAEKYDLPISFHGESSLYRGFPTNEFNFNNLLEVHTLCHPILQMWHATSIIGEEIPERYDLDWLFLEAGQSWVQFLGNRMDREYAEFFDDVPNLTRKPSEYLSEFYYGTQPLEEPSKPDDLSTILEMNDLEDQIVFASDYPHQDFDAPKSITSHEGLTVDQKRKILHENMEELFDF